MCQTFWHTMRPKVRDYCYSYCSVFGVVTDLPQVLTPCEMWNRDINPVGLLSDLRLLITTEMMV